MVRIDCFLYIRCILYSHLTQVNGIVDRCNVRFVHRNLTIVFPQHHSFPVFPRGPLLDLLNPGGQTLFAKRTHGGLPILLELVEVFQRLCHRFTERGIQQIAVVQCIQDGDDGRLVHVVGRDQQIRHCHLSEGIDHLGDVVPVRNTLCLPIVGFQVFLAPVDILIEVVHGATMGIRLLELLQFFLFVFVFLLELRQLLFLTAFDTFLHRLQQELTGRNAQSISLKKRIERRKTNLR